jgi:hypothetical protein
VAKCKQPSGDDNGADDADRNPEPHGWDAITAACERVYGDQKEQHFHPVLPAGLGGSEPLNGISAYKADKPVPHWHFVTYGFSELYEKESTNLEESGYGFELTFRLTRPKGEKQAPNWAISFLQNLGKYVFRTGNAFDAGHNMNLAGPINLGTPDTAIRAITFVEDPEFGTIDTPNGRVAFLQVVGLTLDELRAITDWNAAGVVGVIREANPMLVTDLDRKSALDDPALAERVRVGAERDGSTTAASFIESLRWEKGKGRGKTRKVTLTVGANGVDSVLRMLRGRTRHGRPFWVQSRAGTLNVRAADAAEWREDDGTLVIDATPALTAEMLAGLLPKRGEYTFPAAPWLTVVVEPSEIRDSTGKLTEVVG